MADSTPLTIGAKANCSDGVCGRVTQVVINPLDDDVTHVVVEPEHREGLGRLVPIGWVEPGPDGVAIRCSKAELEQLPKAEVTRFLPGTEGPAPYDAEQQLTWPFFGGNTTLPVTDDTLPVGEVAVRRGEEVHATDGHIGEVEGLIVEPGKRHVTHVLLKEGHLFGRKEVSIPISAVAHVDEDGIRLSLAKHDVEELPAVDFERRAR
jgi:sporulation protein YlmC with PRC-barrel domain